MELRFRVQDNEIQVKAKYLGDDCKYHLKVFPLSFNGTQDVSALIEALEDVRKRVRDVDVPYCQCFPVTMEIKDFQYGEERYEHTIWRQAPYGDFACISHPEIHDMPEQMAVNLKDKGGNYYISEKDREKMGYGGGKLIEIARIP